MITTYLNDFKKLFDIDNLFIFLKYFIGNGAITRMIAADRYRILFREEDSTVFALFYRIVNHILTITL